MVCNVWQNQGQVLEDDGGMLPGSALDDIVAARLWEVSAAVVSAADASGSK